MNGKTVIVVDDDEAFLAAVARILRVAGYGVATTSDSRKVPAMIAERPPNLVITDIVMPDRDGVEVIADIRRRGRGIKVLAVTGRGHMGDLDLLAMARTLGADDSLSKPFDPDELLAKVKALLAPPQAR